MLEFFLEPKVYYIFQKIRDLTLSCAPLHLVHSLKSQNNSLLLLLLIFPPVLGVTRYRHTCRLSAKI